MREIHICPVLSTRRQHLVARCAELVERGEGSAFLYLAASYPILDHVTSRILDGKRNPGLWGSSNVHLFRGFARHLLSTALEVETGLPLDTRTPIDDEGFPVRRALVARIVARLVAAGRLRALSPLANREGCIASITSLIGEIERAGKTSAELAGIVAARARDLELGGTSGAPAAGGPPLQIDFDREIGLVYSAYEAALQRHGLTEDDADQLRALQVLRGEVDGREVTLPWLSRVRLLVLDGFFDFTPVQGEMLRILVGTIPNVIVNLNGDQRNGEIFRPFEQTVEQLASMASFEILIETEEEDVHPSLSRLRGSLFNPLRSHEDEADDQDHPPRALLLECADRETEVRAIAKEIKRLINAEGYRLSEIVLIVRQQAAYAELIARVFDEESVPNRLERRLDLARVPAVRAATKLLRLLGDLGDEPAANARIGEIADALKAEYFRLSDEALADLRSRFARDYSELPSDAEAARLRWDVDALENIVAYVGSELRVGDWLARARRLIERAREVQEKFTEEAAVEGTPDADSDAEPTRSSRLVQPGSRSKPGPARGMRSAAIAWALLVMERVVALLGAVKREGEPRAIQASILELLDNLQYSRQVSVAISGGGEEALSQGTLALRGLEGVRRALAAAVRAVEMASEIVPVEREKSPPTLGQYLAEVGRCIESQVLRIAGADRDGLRVLEATDVRGLKFRAVFIAGLEEGGFPLRTSRDWVYPPDERERLKEYGLTLEDISTATLLKEEHYFYQAACRATRRLYLSRAVLMEDGAQTVASYYIEELRRALLPGSMDKRTVRPDYDGQALLAASTPRELVVSAVRQEQRGRHPGQRRGLLAAAGIERLLNRVASTGWLSGSAIRRIEMERVRAGRDFGVFDGVISEPGLVRMLQQRYGEGHLFSASQLSEYGRCPFRFLAGKVLKLEPRSEAAMDLRALDAGSLLHDVLRRFLSRYRGQSLVGRDREALKEELWGVADEVFDEYEQAVPPLNPQVWRIDREIRKVLLAQVLEYELRTQMDVSATGVRPIRFELSFGMTRADSDPESTSAPLRYTRPGARGDETVELSGQIDRVDQARDGTTLAYDYKLTKGADLKDLEQGRDLQLGIYLKALEDLFFPGNRIAGGGYYKLRGGSGRRNQGIYRRSMSEYTGLGRVGGNLSDEEWEGIRREMEARIWEFIDGIRSGRFDVLPSKPEQTCTWCDFPAVCRYETHRIRWKLDREHAGRVRSQG